MNDGMEHGLRLDVTGSLGPAWNRMKLVLFQPFQAGKWFAIGLMVFMEMLVQAGGGNFNPGGSGRSGSSSGSGVGPSSPAEVADLIDKGFVWIDDNLELVLGIGIPAVGLLACLYVLLLWLSSRGMLMFIRVIARNDANVGDNWRATRFLVGSLFKFRLVVQSVSLLLVFGGLGALAYVLYRLLRRNETEWTAYVFELLPLVLTWFLPSLIGGLVSSLLRNFVAPMMLQFQESCSESFRRFIPVLKQSVGAVIIFLILRVLFQILFGFANMIVVLFTCCIGGLPILNQAITAPFHVFDRAWSMYALRSLGADFDMFIEPAPPAPAQQWGMAPP